MNKVIIQKPFAGFLLKSFRTKLDGVDVQNKDEARVVCEASVCVTRPGCFCGTGGCFIVTFYLAREACSV